MLTDSISPFCTGETLDGNWNPPLLRSTTVSLGRRRRQTHRIVEMYHHRGRDGRTPTAVSFASPPPFNSSTLSRRVVCPSTPRPMEHHRKECRRRRSLLLRKLLLRRDKGSFAACVQQRDESRRTRAVGKDKKTWRCHDNVYLDHLLNHDEQWVSKTYFVASPLRVTISAQE